MVSATTVSQYEAQGYTYKDGKLYSPPISYIPDRRHKETTAGYSKQVLLLDKAGQIIKIQQYVLKTTPNRSVPRLEQTTDYAKNRIITQSGLAKYQDTQRMGEQPLETQLSVDKAKQKGLPLAVTVQGKTYTSTNYDWLLNKAQSSQFNSTIPSSVSSPAYIRSYESYLPGNQPVSIDPNQYQVQNKVSRRADTPSLWVGSVRSAQNSASKSLDVPYKYQTSKLVSLNPQSVSMSIREDKPELFLGEEVKPKSVGGFGRVSERTDPFRFETDRTARVASQAPLSIVPKTVSRVKEKYQSLLFLQTDKLEHRVDVSEVRKEMLQAKLDKSYLLLGSEKLGSFGKLSKRDASIPKHFQPFITKQDVYKAGIKTINTGQYLMGGQAGVIEQVRERPGRIAADVAVAAGFGVGEVVVAPVLKGLKKLGTTAKVGGGVVIGSMGVVYAQDVRSEYKDAPTRYEKGKVLGRTALETASFLGGYTAGRSVKTPRLPPREPEFVEPFGMNKYANVEGYKLEPISKLDRYGNVYEGLDVKIIKKPGQRNIGGGVVEPVPFVSSSGKLTSSGFINNPKLVLGVLKEGKKNPSTVLEGNLLFVEKTLPRDAPSRDIVSGVRIESFDVKNPIAGRELARKQGVLQGVDVNVKDSILGYRDTKLGPTQKAYDPLTGKMEYFNQKDVFVEMNQVLTNKDQLGIVRWANEYGGWRAANAPQLEGFSVKRIDSGVQTTLTDSIFRGERKLRFDKVNVPKQKKPVFFDDVGIEKHGKTLESLKKLEAELIRQKNKDKNPFKIVEEVQVKRRSKDELDALFYKRDLNLEKIRKKREKEQLKLLDKYRKEQANKLKKKKKRPRTYDNGDGTVLSYYDGFVLNLDVPVLPSKYGDLPLLRVEPNLSKPSSNLKLPTVDYLKGQHGGEFTPKLKSFEFRVESIRKGGRGSMDSSRSIPRSFILPTNSIKMSNESVLNTRTVPSSITKQFISPVISNKQKGIVDISFRNRQLSRTVPSLKVDNVLEQATQQRTVNKQVGVWSLPVLTRDYPSRIEPHPPPPPPALPKLSPFEGLGRMTRGRKVNKGSKKRPGYVFTLFGSTLPKVKASKVGSAFTGLEARPEVIFGK